VTLISFEEEEELSKNFFLKLSSANFVFLYSTNYLQKPNLSEDK